MVASASFQSADAEAFAALGDWAQTVADERKRTIKKYLNFADITIPFLLPAVFQAI
jgi:hypothetical protein